MTPSNIFKIYTARRRVGLPTYSRFAGGPGGNNPKPPTKGVYEVQGVPAMENWESLVKNDKASDT